MIVGAPVSSTRVPAAGRWERTVFAEKPRTPPCTFQAKPASTRMPFAKT